MALNRKAVKQYTFSNGVTVPSGTHLVVLISQLHKDESVYPNANTFEGLRFYNLREQNGDQAKYYCANTNTDFLIFGHGQHAWYVILVKWFVDE